MTIVRHILAKDLRRLRWLLLPWLVVVFSRVAIDAARSDLAFDDFTRQLALDNVSGLLLFIDVPMLVLLVSALVHDEPLVGADAFWLTRPIPPRALMTSKLAFAALFLIGAPAIVQSMAVASVTRLYGHSIRLIPGLLFRSRCGSRRSWPSPVSRRHSRDSCSRWSAEGQRSSSPSPPGRHSSS
jgi:hypothetical protein